MPFAAALSSHPVTAHATGEVIGQVIDEIGAHPDLAVLVASPSHTGALEDAAATVRALLAPTVLLGWVAADVDTTIGRGVPAPGSGVGLWAAHTGPVAPVRAADLTSPGWIESGPGSFDRRALVVVGAAGVVVHGPLASGLTVAGAVSHVAGAPIVLDGTAYATGAVGVVLGPGVDLTVIVEQGRRPVGPPSTVTRTDGILLVELDDRPAMSVLIDIARDQVPAGDIALINRSLHLEVTSAQAGLGALPAGIGALHAVRGRDAATGALVTDPEIQPGDVVQFCVRDPKEAEARARQVVSRAGGGALAWRTRPSDADSLAPGGDGDGGPAPSWRTRPPRSLLACQAASLLGGAGGGEQGTDPDTIGIGLFRESPVGLG